MSPPNHHVQSQRRRPSEDMKSYPLRFVQGHLQRACKTTADASNVASLYELPGQWLSCRQRNTSGPPPVGARPSATSRNRFSTRAGPRPNTVEHRMTWSAGVCNHVTNRWHTLCQVNPKDAAEVGRHPMIAQCLPNTIPGQSVQGVRDVQGHHQHLPAPGRCFLRQASHSWNRRNSGAPMPKPEPRKSIVK